MKRLILAATIFGAAILATPSYASSVGLADWCINVNGSVDSSSITNNPSNACNGGTNPAIGGVNKAGFDVSLENAANTLGSIILTLGPGLNYVGFYADYDVDFATLGSFSDQGTTGGSLPANWSYELNDPNSSSLFFDFAGINNAAGLPNTDAVAVGTNGDPQNSIPQCCDVAFALAITNINVPAGGTGTVTFSVSTLPPQSGFYIVQTNYNTIPRAIQLGDSIYLTANVNIQGGATSGVPEPSTWTMAAGALLGGIGLVRRRRRA
jgi:hypothetical protein